VNEMATGWVDPVVEEVRARGRTYTERFRHDIHAIMEDLRNDQRENPERYVSQITVVRPSTPEKPENG
jgi:hypothetical protein